MRGYPDYWRQADAGFPFLPVGYTYWKVSGYEPIGAGNNDLVISTNAPAGSTLYITAGNSLFSIKMSTRGFL